MTETSPRTLRITTSDSRRAWHVEWHASLDSTMERASMLARLETDEDIVVVADYQHSGRGTHGRSWIAPRGSCLMFSFVICPRLEIADLLSLPLTIAATIRDEVNVRYRLDVELDPPNDLMIGGRKVAGVLCQSHIRGANVDWVVCGVGLNTNLSAQDVTVPDSTSLRIASGQIYQHEVLLGHLLGALDRIRDL